MREDWEELGGAVDVWIKGWVDRKRKTGGQMGQDCPTTHFLQQHDENPHVPSKYRSSSC